jgi:hypothetical protein
MVTAYAYSKKYNYIIGWNAKSGCTLFRNIFLELHKDEVKHISNKHHEIDKDFPLPNNLENIPVFILVRNPYSRIVSMFTNKYCGGKGNNWLYDRINLKEDNFLNFVKFIDNLKKNNNLNNFDCHISEQSNNLIKNGNNCTILKLETFNKDIIKMYSSDKLKILLPKVTQLLIKFSNDSIKTNSTKINNNTDNTIDYKLHVYNKNSTIFPNYKKFYGKIIQNIIYNIYIKDFIIFKYDKNVL